MAVRKTRDSQKSKEDILKAAEHEFAAKGIYGARIDEIAAKANINKRMIYEYFGNKEELYKTVLADVYTRLSRKEMDVLSENASCIDTIKKVISLYFDHLSQNPTYVNLILWENLNRGAYIKEMDFKNIKTPEIDLLKNVINRGIHEGVFKPDIDTEQVVLSILTYTFSYFSNRYTLSKIMDQQLDSEENIKRRLKNVTDMFISYLCINIS